MVLLAGYGVKLGETGRFVYSVTVAGFHGVVFGETSRGRGLPPTEHDPRVSGLSELGRLESLRRRGGFWLVTAGLALTRWLAANTALEGASFQPAPPDP